MDNVLVLVFLWLSVVLRRCRDRWLSANHRLRVPLTSMRNRKGGSCATSHKKKRRRTHHEGPGLEKQKQF